MMMCGAMGGWFFNVLSVVLLVALIALLTMLVVKTIAAMRAGKICVPE